MMVMKTRVMMMMMMMMKCVCVCVCVCDVKNSSGLMNMSLFENVERLK